jgi:hypothetical protein
MSGEIIPFDMHDDAHPRIHHSDDDEVDMDRLLQTMSDWSATFHSIANGPEPLAAALAREALTR